MPDKDKFLLNERIRVDADFSELDQTMATDSPKMFKEIVCAAAVETYTECGSKIGIAVALIEGMIATSRILFMMDLSSLEVQEALKDLKDVYELSMLTTLETESPQGRMLDVEWRKRDG